MPLPLLDRPDLIVVLGMHRSGTSTIARALEVMRVELGNDFLPPDQNNAKGYWEDSDTQSLNRQMLAAIKQDWDHLSTVSSREVDVLVDGGFLEKALELLQEKVDCCRTFGVKDPRITKLLPFWDRVIEAGGFKARYVLAIRHPLSVAVSLEKRDGLSSAHALYLWLEYTLMPLKQQSCPVAAVVDYDRLLHDPSIEIKRLASRLGLLVDDRELNCFVSDFLEDGLRHSQYKLQHLEEHADSPDIVWQVYQTLLSAASDCDQWSGESLEHQKQNWLSQMQELQPLFNHIDMLDRQLKSARQLPSIMQSIRDIRLQISKEIRLRTRLRNMVNRS